MPTLHTLGEQLVQKRRNVAAVSCVARLLLAKVQKVPQPLDVVSALCARDLLLLEQWQVGRMDERKSAHRTPPGALLQYNIRCGALSALARVSTKVRHLFNLGRLCYKRWRSEGPYQDRDNNIVGQKVRKWKNILKKLCIQ